MIGLIVDDTYPSHRHIFSIIIQFNTQIKKEKVEKFVWINFEPNILIKFNCKKCLTVVTESGTSHSGQAAKRMFSTKKGLQQKTNVKNTRPKT